MVNCSTAGRGSSLCNDDGNTFFITTPYKTNWLERVAIVLPRAMSNRVTVHRTQV